MKKIIALLLTALILLSLAGCQKPTDQLSAQDLEILAERRDKAENYMRHMATVLWRASEDIIYSNYSRSEDPLLDDMNYRTLIEAGRLYQGLPYSHAAGDAAAFLEYAGEPDENGIYTISGLTWHPLNGGSSSARIGNDCASAVGLAWGQLGNSLAADKSTKHMTEENGYLRVGNYKSDSTAHSYTYPVCVDNGGDVMFAAYAQLQKADGLVRRNEKDTNGHAMMVVDVHIDYKESGTVNGTSSYVTVLEQTSGLIEKAQFYYNEELKENVYQTYIIDKKYTFMELFGLGYLPITCKELIDPSPADEIKVVDSIETYNADSIAQGILQATRFIGSVSVIISDNNGNMIQQCSASPVGRDLYKFDMQTFVTDRPEVLRGSIDINALSEGTYHCKVVCRLITGDTITVRDFVFTA